MTRKYVTPVTISPKTREQFLALQWDVQSKAKRKVTQDELIQIMITSYRRHMDGPPEATQ